MHVFFLILVTAAAVAVICSVCTLLVLLMAAAIPQSRHLETEDRKRLSLIVLIPAHDEELVLAATLDSLAAQDYPRNDYEVVVIADNCSDATADIARARGATTLMRVNTEQRGKGYALDWALSQLLYRSQPADAVVIVDADTWVAPDFLCLMASRLQTETDRRGFCALQGRYGVLNAGQGWRAALMAGAFDLFNHVKPLGRDRLGLSVGLKGNGMAFTRAVLEQTRWRGDSLTEDIDFGIDLARQHNLRVGYVPEACVLAQMPTGADQAASQRARWEGGRGRLLRERALPLFLEGLRRRSLLFCDTAWDLIQPPLVQLGALLLLWLGLIFLGITRHWLAHPAVWAALGLGSLFGLLGYILGGLRVAGAPPEAYAALLRAPLYAVWKFCLLVARMRRREGAETTEWVRTARMPIAGASETHPK